VGPGGVRGRSEKVLQFDFAGERKSANAKQNSMIFTKTVYE
jgi:hypothetical protein